MVALLQEETETKICKKCKNERPISEFKIHFQQRDGKRYRYKTCQSCMLTNESEVSSIRDIKRKIRQAWREAPYTVIVDIFRQNPDLFLTLIDYYGSQEFNAKVLARKKEQLKELRAASDKWLRDHPNRAAEIGGPKRVSITWDKAINELLEEMENPVLSKLKSKTAKHIERNKSEIQKMIKNGLPLREIANKFNVNPSTLMRRVHAWKLDRRR